MQIKVCEKSVNIVEKNVKFNHIDDPNNNSLFDFFFYSLISRKTFSIYNKSNTECSSIRPTYIFSA